MPRGKYVNHKGRSRHFTSPDELERERKKEQEKKWRKKKDEDGDEDSSEEEETEEKAGDGAAAKKAESGSEEESESESDDDENKKKKGVEGLIEIENPNRIVKKVKKPAAKVEDDTKEGANPNHASGSGVKPELSRREREEIEKQRARAHYQKLHAEGKTEEARADLARLALIRKQREEAAKKREDEKKAKDAATAAKQDQVNKALGKKS